ncbi:GNAT family N-acetyltransferase [Metabacillus lacus]|uniref:GNAT family N-acetyltransferase n=1 Tax=Metabacillus lacus TaxID=1983721 RepID=UPI0014784E37|nr:GNAT family N-acetyltransferase [Metabacillus lacus]
MILIKASSEEKSHFMNLMLLADESENMINKYLGACDVYAAFGKDTEAIAAAAVQRKGEKSAEIMNMAVRENLQGRGIGKAMLTSLLQELKKENVTRVMVGTANSSLDNIAFYQKAGFRMKEIRRDYFLAYPEIIVENGIRALDMIVFQQEI